MITCGANLRAAATSAADFFQVSSSGRNANVSQYGPTAFVRSVSANASSETPSKNAETYAAAGAVGAGRAYRPAWIPALLKRTVMPCGSRLAISEERRFASVWM
jgi:hypothetical protein